MSANVLNPIQGLPAIEVLNLMERGANVKLDGRMKYKAIVVVEDYLHMSNESSAKGVLDSLALHPEFNIFIAAARRALLS